MYKYILKKLKTWCLKNQNSLQDNRLFEIQHLLKSKRFPTFQIGDIVTGENLPSDLDFVYCKKLLQNVLEVNSGYPNTLQGEDGVKSVIKNIATSVKQGGRICLVEPVSTDFMPYLEQAGLELIRCCRIQRNDIVGQKRNMLYKTSYLIYHYSKI
jgi:hypothetical protein